MSNREIFMREKPKRDYDKRIMRLRNYLGLTQKEFADKVGVSVTKVINWEREGSAPKLDDYLNLSRVFGKRADYIMNWGRYQDFPSIFFKHDCKTIFEFMLLSDRDKQLIAYNIKLLQDGEKDAPNLADNYWAVPDELNPKP